MQQNIFTLLRTKRVMSFDSAGKLVVLLSQKYQNPDGGWILSRRKTKANTILLQFGLLLPINYRMMDIIINIINTI